MTHPAHGAWRLVGGISGRRQNLTLSMLRWDHVNLDGQPDADPPIPPSVNVWHSVLAGGDTKTKKSRRTLALPRRCVTALRLHREQQLQEQAEAGKDWQPLGLVFATTVGTALDAANAPPGLPPLAGLDPAGWTPRDLRHSFVSLLSDNGVPLEAIADLCGHAGTTVTEKVYRHQLRPVLLGGA